MTAPKSRGILFSAEMVKAIIAGTKTQTRRIIKNPEYCACLSGDCPHENQAECDKFIALYAYEKWPLGLHLYVKETFGIIPDDGGTYVYRATDPEWSEECGLKWKPSIFMPRAASRITLEIVSIGVERLNDICDADALAEGVKLNSTTHYASEARDAFMQLWETINGKNSWQLNPYVWRIAFRRLSS